MYLYFDRTGVLKEIINDEALRQGNYGINKIYVYVENRNYISIDVSYVNSEGTIIGSQNHSTFTNPDADTPADNCYIPYNPERDLKFFKYWTPYKFLIIDLEVTTTELNNTEVALGPGPLDVPGIVHCSLSANLETSDVLQLGDVNFKVQPAPGLNNQVAPEHYLSLSNYLYLKSLINGTQEISGHKTFKDKVDVEGELEIGEKTVSGISDGPALLFSDLNGNIWSIGTNNNNLLERDYDLTLPNDSGQLVVSSTNTNLTVNDLTVDEFIIFSDDSDKAILSKTGNKNTYYTFGDRVTTGTSRYVHVATVEDTQKKLYKHEVWLRDDDSTTTFEVNIINSSEDELSWQQVWNYIASGFCTYNHINGLDLTDDEFTIRGLAALNVGNPSSPKIYLCSVNITNQDTLTREVVELEAIDEQFSYELE